MLRRLIREIAAEMPSAQPDEIAGAVVRRTPRGDMRAYYQEAVRNDVREVLSAQLRTALVRAFPSNRRRTSSGWPELVESRIHTANGYLTYGDCTLDDMDFIIGERRSHVSDVNAIVRMHERIRARMVALKVDRVRDLPPEDLSP